jgi:ABC-type glycerol-3-phosphate transport system substrate-binding protein
MVYSQGGRVVDTKRQRLVVNSPEGRNAWKLLADMVLVDKSAPLSVLEYDWMSASDIFSVGKAAMLMSNATLETFPPAGRALTDIMMEYFANVVTGKMQPMPALEELQARLDDYAVPE